MSIGQARVIRAEEEATVETVAVELATERACPRVIRAELAEAVQQAQAILAEAQAQAESIRARARQDAEREAGLALASARSQAREELSTEWAALRAREARADEAGMERTIAIARLLAERIILTQLQLDPELLVPMARQAIAQFWRAEAITVLACAHDLQVLRAHADELGAGSAALQFECDESCGPGSIRIRTSKGSLDADVAVQLERLVQALRRG